jgi:glycosyltransferase involved in cell wall biosynthesis
MQLERFLARHFAVKVVCMSQAIADQLDPANVEVVYETVDPAEFRPELAGRFRERVWDPDDVLVGAVGRIDTWKGFDVLLDASRKERRPTCTSSWRAPVTGKEQLAIDLATRDANLRRPLARSRTDTPELFADLDLFAPSTEPEPYGIVVVEALASGAPVVVTDAGGAPEIVARAAPGSGTTVPPGDGAALADAIVRIAPVTTDAAARKGRPALQPPGDTGRMAEIFREAAEGGHRRH